MTVRSNYTETSMVKKQAGRVWYKYLTKNLLKSLGFTKSDIDECVFYKGNSCISYIHMTQ